MRSSIGEGKGTRNGPIQWVSGGMGVTSIFLLRHGALAADARERFVGQMDLPLSPEGARQAEALGQILRTVGIDSVYCSDLLRSRQTADAIVGTAGIRVAARRDLREIALGEWEGLSRREVAARFPEQYAARGDDIEGYRIAGGESFADCRGRIVGAWQDIVRRGERRVVIVGHAGANRVLLCHLLGMPVASLFNLGQDYGCVNLIDYEEGRSDVRLINGRAGDLCGHLPNRKGDRPCLDYERTES